MKINGKQNLKLRSGLNKFKNYFKGLAVRFEVYADSESLLRWIKSNNRNNNTSYTEKYQYILLVALLTKLLVLMINLAKKLFLLEEKIQSINLLKQFLKNMIIDNK